MGTIPTPPTFVAGASAGVAAQLNQMRDAVNFWANTPKVYAYQSAGTSLANNATTVLPLGAELYDIVQSGDTAMHDLTTNNSRLVARTAGKYTITGGVAFASNATGDRTASVRKNAAGSSAGGSIVSAARSPASTSGATIANLSSVEIDMAVGDYVELFALQSSGGALLTNASGSADTWLSMRLSGA